MNTFKMHRINQVTTFCRKIFPLRQSHFDCVASIQKGCRRCESTCLSDGLSDLRCRSIISSCPIEGAWNDSGKRQSCSNRTSSLNKVVDVTSIPKYVIEPTKGIGDAYILKRIMKESFFVDEPTTSMLGLKGNECNGELINVLLSGVDFEQSLVAKSVVTSEIVGFALNGEFDQDSLSSDLSRWSRKMRDSRNRKLLEIWKAISKQFDLREVCQGKTMELYYLGVLPKARGQGIGKQLVSTSINSARRYGYSLVQVVCTSGKSAHICKSLGLTHHCSVMYDSLIMDDGRRVVTRSPPPPDELVDIYYCKLRY